MFELFILNLPDWDLMQWLSFHAFIAAGGLWLDRVFGEFLNANHPVVWMGKFISQFEKHFYQDRIFRGSLLWLATITFFTTLSVSVWLLSFTLPWWLQIALLMILTSTLFAHRMLYDCVKAVANSNHPQTTVAMLVSRDTQHLSKNDAYKAAIETYAENLSDGVVAPVFFALLFGLPGLVLYKAINTLDSMVGYRTLKYENFGKTSAKLDDFANWIPARLTAMLIMLVNRQWKFWRFYRNGTQHDSPNAGHPITAIALSCDCRLGGPTMYFGKVKDKAYFGDNKATTLIDKTHLSQALSKRTHIDFVLIAICSSLSLLGFMNL